MKGREDITLDDLFEVLNKDPGFRKEYRRQAPFYELILEVLARRKQLGLTQAELAARAGTHQSNISKIEAGELDIRLSTLVDLAEALESKVRIWLDPCDDQEYQLLFETSATIKTKAGSPITYEVTEIEDTRVPVRSYEYAVYAA